jgi:hypothetical protein
MSGNSPPVRAAVRNLILTRYPPQFVGGCRRSRSARLTQAQAGELHQVVVGHRIRFPSRTVFTGWGSEVFLGALALRRRDAYRLLSMRPEDWRWIGTFRNRL